MAAHNNIIWMTDSLGVSFAAVIEQGRLLQAPVLLLDSVHQHSLIKNRFTLLLRHWTAAGNAKAEDEAHRRQLILEKLGFIGSVEYVIRNPDHLSLLHHTSRSHASELCVFNTISSLEVQTDLYQSASQLAEALRSGQESISMNFSTTTSQIQALSIQFKGSQVSSAVSNAKADIGGASFVHGGVATKKLLSSHNSQDIRLWDDGVSPQNMKIALEFFHYLQSLSANQSQPSEQQLKGAIERMIEIERKNFAPDEFKPVSTMWKISNSLSRGMGFRNANSQIQKNYKELQETSVGGGGVGGSLRIGPFGLGGGGSFQRTMSRLQKHEDAFVSDLELNEFIEENGAESGEELRVFARGCNIYCIADIDSKITTGFSVSISQAVGTNIQQFKVEMPILAPPPVVTSSKFLIRSLQQSKAVSHTEAFFPVDPKRQYECTFHIHVAEGAGQPYFGSCLAILTPYDQFQEKINKEKPDGSFWYSADAGLHVAVGSIFTPSACVKPHPTDPTKRIISFRFGPATPTDPFLGPGTLPDHCRYLKGAVAMDVYHALTSCDYPLFLDLFELKEI